MSVRWPSFQPRALRYFYYDLGVSEIVFLIPVAKEEVSIVVILDRTVLLVVTREVKKFLWDKSFIHTYQDRAGRLNEEGLLRLLLEKRSVEVVLEHHHHVEQIVHNTHEGISKYRGMVDL